MNTEHVDPVVKAVIYEGHILYPYRPSAIKNQRRFTFGRIYPRAFSEAEEGRERWTMTTQCLLEAARSDPAPRLEVRVRFLHPVRRQVYRVLRTGHEDILKPVPNLVLDGEAYHSWMDVDEQTVDLPVMSVNDTSRLRTNFSFHPSTDREHLHQDGRIVGVVEHRREMIVGAVEVEARELECGLFKVTACIRNTTDLPDGVPESEERLLLQTLASAHTVLQAVGGRFVSLTDPPERYASRVDGCRNDGTWPVLVGRPGQDDTLLSSPIILYDYPEVAAESKGDLFDSTEIDELLSLRIMTLTEEEKAEMRGVDAFARRILQRTESLTADDLLEMHGTLREWKSTAESRPPEVVEIGDMPARAGDRVRVHPRRRADAMDLSLAGRTGRIEAIEQDFEGRIYVAVVFDDDPGRDLGMLRQPGHRFFYMPDELERLEKVS